jgi:multidrug resistance efflux pump
MSLASAKPFDIPTPPMPGAPTATPPARVPLFNRRGFRIGLGLALVGLATLVLVPRLASYSAEDAIIQGRTALLQTPIEGVIEQVTVRPGQTVARDTPIAAIENPRVDRSFLNELLTERNYLRRRVENLQTQATGLLALRDDLESRRMEVTEGAGRILAKEIVAREAEIAAARARLRAADGDLERQTILAAKGHTTAKALDAARAERDSLAARVAELEAQVELLKEEATQADRGVFMADGRFGAPYAEVRRDEIDITLLDIYSRREQETSRSDQIDRQIAAEEARLLQVAAAAVEAPFDGVVWKVLASAGTEVVVGAEVAQVLDCSSTFLEVLVSESRFERVAVGDPIRYRPIGTDSFRTGTVTALRGGQAAAEDRTLAASLDSGRTRSFRVWAELDPTDADANAAAFCNVGRRVDVRFEREVSPLDWAKGLWSAL